MSKCTFAFRYASFFLFFPFFLFRFRTVERDAMLMSSSDVGDFSVYISCGFLKLEYSLVGIGEHSILHHSKAVDDGKWHRVHIQRRPHCRLQLTVDSHTTRDNSPPSLPEHCPRDHWYNFTVGGLDHRQNHGNTPLTSIPSLRGCMGTFRFDRISSTAFLYSAVQNQLAGAAETKSADIQLNCQMEPSFCKSSPCKHGGQCIERVDSYECDCQHTSYTGPQCNDGKCNVSIVSVMQPLSVRCSH